MTTPLSTLETIEQHKRLDVPDAARAPVLRGLEEERRVNPELKDEIRRAKRAAIRQEAFANGDAQLEESIAADSRAIDAEIEQVRAKARSVDAAELTARVPALVTFLASTSSVEMIEGLLEDVALSQHDFSITVSFSAAIARLEEMGKPVPGGRRGADQKAAELARGAAQRLRATLAAWREQHPSPSTAIRVKEQQKERIALRRRSDWQTFVRAAELG
jgi:hypothetical protein